MSIEKRVERLEQAVQIAEQPLKHILFRVNDQTEDEAIEAHGRERLNPGWPIEFVNIVGVNPAPRSEGAIA